MVQKNGCPPGTIPIPNTTRTKNICIKPHAISEALNFIERRLKDEGKYDSKWINIQKFDKSTLAHMYEAASGMIYLDLKSIKRKMLK